MKVGHETSMILQAILAITYNFPFLPHSCPCLQVPSAYLQIAALSLIKKHVLTCTSYIVIIINNVQTSIGRV